MKHVFKRVALLSAALMTSISTFAISTGGAVAAGLGAAAAVTLISVGIHKSNKRKAEQENSQSDVKSTKKTRTANKKTDQHSATKSSKSSATAQPAKYRSKIADKRERLAAKKDIKSQIADKREELKDHKYNLKKLKRSGKRKSPEASEVQSMMDSIKQDIKDLDKQLRDIY